MDKLTNKEVVRRFFLEIYNNQDYEATYKYFAPNYKDRGPDRAIGPKEAIEVFKKTHHKFTTRKPLTFRHGEEVSCP